MVSTWAVTATLLVVVTCLTTLPLPLPWASAAPVKLSLAVVAEVLTRTACSPFGVPSTEPSTAPLSPANLPPVAVKVMVLAMAPLLAATSLSVVVLDLMEIAMMISLSVEMCTNEERCPPTLRTLGRLRPVREPQTLWNRNLKSSYYTLVIGERRRSLSNICLKNSFLACNGRSTGRGRGGVGQRYRAKLAFCAYAASASSY